jgi:hypothetical protein
VVQLLERDGDDRWRVVVDVAPSTIRRLFEARLPRDATDGELDDFLNQLRGILRKRRATDQETTRKERP